jgi:chemotaxis protein methyltransferase CheR
LGKFDVVLMRNVAIYFSAQFKAELVKKISNCLNPGGILILGASESLSGITHDFELKECGRGLYYQLKGGPSALATTSTASSLGRSSATATLIK